MGYFYPCIHQTHLECVLLKRLIFLVSSDHRIQAHLKFQSCLITEYAGNWFLVKAFSFFFFFFFEALTNNMWWCRGCFIIFLRFSDPEIQSFFCNSPAVVLGESLATQTLLLTVHLDDIDTRPLSGSFVTFFCWLEILHYFPDGGNGNFLKATSLICEAQLSFAAHQKYLICFFWLWCMMKGI